MAVIRAEFSEDFATDYQQLIPSLTNHPEDRHVLAAAIVRGASVIVSHNLRHFPESALTPYNIEARHPDRFLLDMIERDSQIMERILREQAGDLRRSDNPMETMLIGLHHDAPRFVDAVVERFGLPRPAALTTP
jgi:hypothetical protein